MFVHHSGKNSYKGMRGSSYLLGTVDTAIQVENINDFLLVQIEKQKDGIEGTFQLKLKKHIDSLVVFDNDINLKFRSKTGYILDSKKTLNIQEIIGLLKLKKSITDISKQNNIEISLIKRIIKKDLLKKEYSDFDELISEYGISDNNDKNWIKTIY